VLRLNNYLLSICIIVLFTGEEGRKSGREREGRGKEGREGGRGREERDSRRKIIKT
jgi:hypothetical protein